MRKLSSAFCQNGEILELIKELDPLHTPLYQIQDEITFGRLFGDTFKSVLKFNVTARTWFVYDGVKWTEDTGSVVVGKLAETFARMLKVYLAEIVSGDETQFESDYQKYALKLGSRNMRLKMIEDSKNHTNVKMEDFDKNVNLLNVQNGVIDLNTFEFMEHDSELLLSKVCACSYNPDANSGDWEKFVSEVLEDDQEKINYIQRLFGYALTADNSREECYLCYGSSTRNGKSTMLRVMETMMGTYSMSIKPESLAQRKNDGRQASGDIARLKGCRFLHCSEPQKGMVLDVAQLKALTGRDIITARNLYEREFQFIPVFKLFFNSNVRPMVNDLTLFSSARIKVIEFNRHFSEEEQDVHLKEKLESQENLSALLNWCLIGLKEFRLHENLIPQSVKLATELYKRDSDKVQNFIDECITVSAVQTNLPVKTCYDAFRKWCSANGYRCEGKRTFKELLSGKIPISASGTVNGVTIHNVLHGYTLTEEGKEYAYGTMY